MPDAVNHPEYYRNGPVECIEVIRGMRFNIGSAIKYLWRAGLKKDVALSDLDKEIEDLRKAKWMIDDRITELNRQKANAEPFLPEHPGSCTPTECTYRAYEEYETMGIS